MTLQIFLHFFHHKFVTSLQSTSLSSAASALSLRRIGDALLLQRRSMTARAVSPSVNPRQRRGTRIDADAPRSAAADALLHRIYSGTALRCISPSPLYPRTRCPGLTENGSALRTSSSTLSSASPVVAHLRRALCGSRAATPCVLAALIRMGLLKIARLQRADIASSPPHRHHHRTHRRGATTLCHNPVRGAQQSVPGLDTPLLSACRRYATTASIPTQHQRRAHSVRSISLTLPSVEPTARRRRATAS